MVETILKVIQLWRNKSVELEKVCREKLRLAEGEKPKKLWDVYEILRKQQITLRCQNGSSQKQNRAIVHQILKVCSCVFMIFVV